MRPISTIAALLCGLGLVAGTTLRAGATLAAADGGSTAITVDSTTVLTPALVRELKIIAANEKLARVLEKDDIKLVPRRGTIAPELAAAWVNTRVNQVVVDREFARRGLSVTPTARRMAKKNAAKLFRGKAVFDAFPRSFRQSVLARQERIDALAATFPKTAEPTQADIDQLFAQTRLLCRDEKLVAQILVETRHEANALTAALAQGADFATLARERSADTSSAVNGGIFTCVGAPRFWATEPAVQKVVQNLPIGGTSGPVPSQGGYTVLRILPFTFDDARSLLEQSWRAEHVSPFSDFVKAQLLAARIRVAKRFASVQRNPSAVGIAPLSSPVSL
jgi:hypothetical protein